MYSFSRSLVRSRSSYALFRGDPCHGRELGVRDLRVGAGKLLRLIEELDVHLQRGQAKVAQNSRYYDGFGDLKILNSREMKNVRHEIAHVSELPAPVSRAASGFTENGVSCNYSHVIM